MSAENSKTYSAMIETLKNMIAAKKIDAAKVRKLFYENKITKEEYEYIIQK